MTKLYVIGNGFDLWHGLPTGYDRFYEFAKATLDELEEFYRLNVAHEGPWCDFEDSLGRFDWRSFYDFHDNTDITADDFRLSEAYGLEDDLIEQADNLVSVIREHFSEWVKEIDVSIAERKMKFTPEDRFLTFNYTSTLQSVYEIGDERIFHVHGRSDKFEDLIFGHSNAMEEEPELDEHGDSSRTIFSDAENAAKYPFFALQKPVGEVLKENCRWFAAQHDVLEVIVIGHSLNEIDLPYFKKLAECATGARWELFCYAPKDKVHHLQQLLRCGVPKVRIRICSYAEINIANSQ